ncbi:MAG: hypothetical protein RJQ21_07250 [Rhodospirillales bacterium]
MRSGGRIRDLALLAPLISLLLFMPPYIAIFDQPVFVFGIPLLLVFIFAVWIVGIIITGLIARRYARSTDWPQGPLDRPRDEV